jgi:hypothetical protein
MELAIMLSELSQARKGQMSHIFPHMWNLDLKFNNNYNNRTWNKGRTGGINRKREGEKRRYCGWAGLKCVTYISIYINIAKININF